MAIDWNKPIRTRDGQKARLACVRKHERLPMVVLIDQGQFESVEGYTKDGRFNLGGEESSFDLVNIETVTIPECWLVCWPRYGSYEVYVIAGGYEAAIEKGAVLVHHQPAKEIEVK